MNIVFMHIATLNHTVPLTCILQKRTAHVGPHCVANPVLRRMRRAGFTTRLWDLARSARAVVVVGGEEAATGMWASSHKASSLVAVASTT